MKKTSFLALLGKNFPEKLSGLSVKEGGGYPPFPLRKKTFFFSDWFSVKAGGGGGGVIWTKSKRTAVFPQETVPQSERGHFSSLTILMRAARARKRYEKRHTGTQTHRHWIFRHCSRSSSPKQDGTEIIERYLFLANSEMLVWNG